MSIVRSKLNFLATVLLSFVVIGLPLPAGAQNRTDGSLQPGSRASQAILQQPLRFEAAADGRMVSRSAGRVLQVGKGGAIGFSSSGQTPIAMYLTGSNPAAAPAGEEQLPGYSNYFLGNDPAKYRTHVSQYRRARLSNVYPNIDLVYYGDKDRLEYDYLIAPHADPAQIRMRFEGAQPELDAKTGSLILNTVDRRKLELRQPVAYQQGADGTRAQIAVSYQALPGHQFAFSLASYDHTRPLVIDPIITYSTYFGGSNLDGIVDMRVDALGNMYFLMQTDSIDLPQLGEPTGLCGTGCGPTNPDPPFATNPGSKYDFYVAALDSIGTTLKFATYIGGSDRDVATSLAYDPSGYLYIAGGSLSTDFPTKNAYSTQPPTNGSGTAILGGTLTKITSDGATLLYSTFFGNGPLSLGSAVQDIGTVSPGNADGLAVSYNGVVYMIGYAGGGTLATKNPLFNEGNDFIAKFDTTKSGASSLLFATRVGDDQSPASGISLSSIALDSSGDLWIYGETNSNTFPVTSGSSVQAACAVANCNTSFLLELNPDATAVSYGTYLGGSVNSSGAPAGNIPLDLVIDASDNLYVTGITNQVDYPLVNQALGYSDLSAYGTTLGYITKVTSGGQSIAYSTLFSGQSNTVAATANGQAAVAVSTGSGYPTKNTLVTPSLSGANRDAVFLTFDTTGSGGASLLTASYVGSSEGTTIPVRVAYDANNILYLSGYTTASDYPTENAYQAACNSCSGSNIAPEGFLTRLQPAPAFGASPASVTFPDIPVGQSSGAMTVTLSNPTGKGVYLSQPTLSDTQDFTTSNNCGGFLEPGKNCILSFTFTPLSSGALSATYSIADLDNQQSPVIVALSGNGGGTQSSVTLSPNPLAFGTINVGATATMSMTLQNSGQSALPIQSATVAGTGFTLSNDGCGSSVAAASSCQYGITVAPTTAGSLAGTLAVVTGTANTNIAHAHSISTLNAQLTATATGGTSTETLSPASVNFGNVYGLATQVVTFTNSGSQAVTITGTTITPSLFSIGGTTCGAQVPANGTCTYTLQFQPIGYGTTVGSFTVQDGSSNPTAALMATGIQDPTGLVTMLPSAITFSNEPVGVQSDNQYLKISNGSAGSIQIVSTDISVGGDGAAQFNVAPILAACAPIAPSNCTYSPASGVGTLTFTISPGGQLNLAVSMADNGPTDVTFSANLAAYWTLVGDPTPTPVRHLLVSAVTGNLLTPAAPTVSPSSLTFPVTANGKTSAAQVVTVGNTGDQAVSFGGITFGGTDPSAFTQTNNCPASLAKGVQCTINVVFAPGATGQDFTATMAVNFTSAAASFPPPVTLTGYTSNTDFTITSDSPEMNIQQGANSTYVLKIAPLDSKVGFFSPITFAVDGLPNNAASYTFSPSTVTPGTATVTVNLNFGSGSGSPTAILHPFSRKHKGIGDKGLPVFAVGFFALLIGRKRLRLYPRLWSLIFFAVFAAGALSVVGCVNDNSFVVTATSGSISHSIQLTGSTHP